jgi:hypothetical protein
MDFVVFRCIIYGILSFIGVVVIGGVIVFPVFRKCARDYEYEKQKQIERERKELDELLSKEKLGESLSKKEARRKKKLENRFLKLDKEIFPEEFASSPNEEV